MCEVVGATGLPPPSNSSAPLPTPPPVAVPLPEPSSSPGAPPTSAPKITPSPPAAARDTYATLSLLKQQQKSESGAAAKAKAISGCKALRTPTIHSSATPVWNFRATFQLPLLLGCPKVCEDALQAASLTPDFQEALVSVEIVDGDRFAREPIICGVLVGLQEVYHASLGGSSGGSGWTGWRRATIGPPRGGNTMSGGSVGRGEEGPSIYLRLYLAPPDLSLRAAAFSAGLAHSHSAVPANPQPANIRPPLYPSIAPTNSTNSAKETAPPDLPSLPPTSTIPRSSSVKIRSYKTPDYSGVQSRVSSNAHVALKNGSGIISKSSTSKLASKGVVGLSAGNNNFISKAAAGATTAPPSYPNNSHLSSFLGPDIDLASNYLLGSGSVPLHNKAATSTAAPKVHSTPSLPPSRIPPPPSSVKVSQGGGSLRPAAEQQEGPSSSAGYRVSPHPHPATVVGGSPPVNLPTSSTYAASTITDSIEKFFRERDRVTPSLYKGSGNNSDLHPSPPTQSSIGDENMKEIFGRFVEKVEGVGHGVGGRLGTAEAAGGAFTKYLEAAKRCVHSLPHRHDELSQFLPLLSMNTPHSHTHRFFYRIL